MKRPAGVTAAMAAATALTVAVGALMTAGAATPGRGVEVRFTAYGVAHVKAADFEGAGLGYGWAFARDNLCLAVDNVITLAGERSLRLGPEATYFDGFANLESGLVATNLDSDVFYRAHLGAETVRATRDYASADLRALVKGYVQGFNRHVAESALPGEECRGEAWFRPLTEDDVWRRLVDVPILETSNQLLSQIVQAAPPGAAPATVPASKGKDPSGAGSNATAFGRRMTGAGGLSFSNPHFPWSGIERLHAVQLTVPGQYDVFGSTLYGLPVPMIGFNGGFGWSITYDTDQHMTLYQLKLDPASPTRYLVDGASVAMERVAIDVPLKPGAGAAVAHRVLWRTRYGFVVALPGMEWTGQTAYALGDPEIANVRMGDGFLDLGRAKDVHEAKEALERHMALPWSNVTAADANGEVLYANIALTPDVDDAKLARCQGDVPQPPHLPRIARILRGSDSACAWGSDPHAVQPGTVPPARRPSLIRDDFAFNSNDSHWLATWDPKAALEGYAATIGNERTVRGERSRMAVLMALGRRDGSDGLGGPGIDAGKWEALFFRSRNLTAELLLDDLLRDCLAHPTVDLGAGGGVVDLGAACRSLGRWDRTDRLDSRGSILFREFLNGLDRLDETGLKLTPKYWAVPFDPADPVNTPRGLAVSPETRAALAKAVARLGAAGIDLDASLRGLQFAERDGAKLPISGSAFSYNMVRAALAEGAPGLAPVAGGNSYMHIVALTKDGPRGRFIVTYSQSTNPRSPHFGDMTALFSRQSLADAPFDDAAIQAARTSESVRLDY